MNDDSLFLTHMLERIRLTEAFTRGGRDEFLANVMMQEAVMRNLEILGEAARRLSDGFRSANDDVPWRKIIGTRNQLIHAYGSIDLGIVWSIVEHDLPVLRPRIEELLRARGIDPATFPS
jgi:uncharacterized protein with HEPN domain